MKNRKTKIIATIGPSSDNYNTLLSLAENGLDVARFNFSHGTYLDHLKKFELIEKLYNEEGLIVTVMCDLKGPKVRAHEFADGGVDFKTGDVCRISMVETKGTKELFSVNYSGLYQDLIVGDLFTFDDGLIAFEVIDKQENQILVCKALNDHYLKSKKGLNAPHIKIKNEYMSNADREDVKFICKQNASYIAASFVRRKEDVLELREVLDRLGREDIKIVSKIESPEAVENIDEIIKVSDAIMVARGDLGVEVELEEVPILQKQIIKKCNIAGIPVIVATHMLESMQFSPRPTRAEVSDVANAILDGADAIMLSAETASGKYPIQSFLTQAKIALKTEEIVDYEKFAENFYEYSNKSQGDAIGISVSKSCLMLDVKLVIMISDSFSAARKLSKFKIKTSIVALVKTRQLAQTLNGLYYGIQASVLDKKLDYEAKDKMAFKIAKEFGIKVGETIILVSDNPKNEKSNLMKILQVE